MSSLPGSRPVARPVAPAAGPPDRATAAPRPAAAVARAARQSPSKAVAATAPVSPSAAARSAMRGTQPHGPRIPPAIGKKISRNNCILKLCIFKLWVPADTANPPFRTPDPQRSMRANHGWIAKAQLEDLVRAKTNYTAENTGRRLRELEEAGVLEVQYRKGHAHYRVAQKELTLF